MVLNGIGIPRMDIFSGDIRIDSIEMPRCNIEGLRNDLSFDEIRHNLLNGKRLQEILWFHYLFVLNYVGLMFSEDLDNYRKILNYKQAGYDLFLIPHIDEGSLRYEVNISTGIGFLYDYPDNEIGQGFQGIICQFDTVNPINQVQFIRPDEVSAYPVDCSTVLN